MKRASAWFTMIFIRHPFPETSQIGIVSRSKWSGLVVENSPRNRRTKVISHRVRQRVILRGGGRVVLAIARGVAVTGACNDILPRRLVTAIPSLPPPKPPSYRRGHCRCRPERTFTGNTTCALCVEKIWEICVCVYNEFNSTRLFT